MAQDEATAAAATGRVRRAHRVAGTTAPEAATKIPARSLVAAPLGLAFAFANAVLFALYIVLADRAAKRAAAGGIDGLAASMAVAAVAVTPVA
ncbi:MAG: hypothetical protein ACXVFT_21680, partial [Solirubrobacteraceae bacterium]